MSLREQIKLLALIVGWLVLLPFVKLAEAVSDICKALRDEWREIKKG